MNIPFIYAYLQFFINFIKCLCILRYTIRYNTLYEKIKNRFTIWFTFWQLCVLVLQLEYRSSVHKDARSSKNKVVTNKETRKAVDHEKKSRSSFWWWICVEKCVVRDLSLVLWLLTCLQGIYSLKCQQSGRKLELESFELSI